MSRPDTQRQAAVQTKLRTSEDVYHRLVGRTALARFTSPTYSLCTHANLWGDPTTLWFDVSGVVVGYDDRFLGRREMELSAFSPGGDVPFHRVQYFRSGGKCAVMATDEGKVVTITKRHWPKAATLLWSREGRIDRIFSNSGEQRATGHDGDRNDHTTVPRTFIEPHHRFQMLPSYSFDADSQEWQSSQPSERRASAAESSTEPPPLTLVSYNVLDDRYPEGAANCKQRWQHLIALLASLDADVIALQEVTPRFLAQLSAQEWVRSSYHLSDTLVSHTAHTLDPSGLLLLSKARPAQLHYREHDNRQLLALFELASGQLLCVANVHLTSDHHRPSSTKRHNQLRSLTDACNWESADGRPVDVVVLGDTNMQDVEAVPDDYTDAAAAVGATYHPIDNALAKRVSRSGRCSRYDRLLIRRSHPAAKLALRIVSAELLGVQPVDGMFLSDHYGLLGRLDYSSAPSSLERDIVTVRRYPPVHTSAVVLLLPEWLCSSLQPIRKQHDPAFRRWPPHINLLYGFASEEFLPDELLVKVI
ncbi:hypothetical protein MMC34_008423, partial [Xylographa carneopallida]|nr:hypothetical protein [Xylographa carneopallida]